MSYFSLESECGIIKKKTGRDDNDEYDPLWKWIKENGTDSFKLTYAEIEEIAGVWISGRQDINESRNGSF